MKKLLFLLALVLILFSCAKENTTKSDIIMLKKKIEVLEKNRDVLQKQIDYLIKKTNFHQEQLSKLAKQDDRTLELMQMHLDYNH